MLNRYIYFLVIISGYMMVGCEYSKSDKENQSDTAINEEFIYMPPLRSYDNVGGDFSLMDYDGRTFHLKDHAGKIKLLFFGFTYCPDVCPTTLSRITQVYDRLNIDRDSLLTIFITLDPERDTKQLLKDYLAYFNVNSIGLIGNNQEIDKIANQYGMKYKKKKIDSSDKYTIDHLTNIYLIDSLGDVRYIFTYKDQPEKMAGIIKRLLHL